MKIDVRCREFHFFRRHRPPWDFFFFTKIHSSRPTKDGRTTKDEPQTCDGRVDQGYGRGGTPIFTDALEPVARVTLYLTDENGLDLGSCFGAAYMTIALRIDFVNIKHEENLRSQKNKGVTRTSGP